jgi:hypothetical protein
MHLGRERSGLRQAAGRLHQRKAGEPGTENKDLDAFLYIEFKIDKEWWLANDLRYDVELSIPVDRVEEIIMEDLRRNVREKYNKGGTKLGSEEVEAKAEILFDKNPEYVVKMREV